jgi:thymidylate kinase
MSQLTDGKLIVIEGPDGVGKSAVANELSLRLNHVGQPSKVMAFPGNEPGTLGKLIYAIHHDPTQFGVERLTPTAVQALHVAAHLDAIEVNILPVLRSGQYVVLDRFWWSTWVYGLVSGVSRHVLRRMVELERIHWRGVTPLAAFLIRRSEPIDRNESKERWNTLNHEYDVLAERERSSHPVYFVENNGSLDETIQSILAALPKTATELPPDDGLRTSKQPQLGFLKASQPSAPPFVFSHILPAKPTVVYDTYWQFAAERQRIFFHRLEGGDRPWTDDPILKTYKFTNAYRASDRVSQYLISKVIYRDDLPSTTVDVFFRIMLFKLFNKIQTWEMLEREVGPITYSSYSFDRYNSVLTRTMSSGQAIYSSAYIMPSGGKILGHTVKHRNHLRLLEMMIGDELHKKLTDARSMREGFQLLRDYPTVGDFLAYQFITDLNYSEMIDFSEMEFVMPGPGALDGIRKCFVDRGGLNEPEIIKFMAESQESEFDRLGLDFRSLWGRPLQLIDCQNLFCEVDKYARVRHPEISGISGRLRIKQKYGENMSAIAYWYPPKWKINHLLKTPVQTNGSPFGEDRF